MFARVLVAALLGGILTFAIGQLSWHVLPFHAQALTEIGDGGGLPVPPPFAALLGTTGAYRHVPQSGPAVPLLIYDRDGFAGDATPALLCSFGMQLTAALLAAALAVLAGLHRRQFAARWAFLASLGVFAALVGPGVDWRRFGYPLPFAWPLAADIAAGWMLAGLAMAKILGRARG